METSLHIAAILGPVLVILSISEYLNYPIWKDVSPSVVYLNGLILLGSGLTVLHFQHTWRLDWTLVINLLGCLLILMGVLRMFFPTMPQPRQSTGTNLLILMLLAAGLFLTYQGYS